MSRILALCLLSALLLAYQTERPAPWAFDPGPDVGSQKELIDLHAAMPSFPAISLEIMRARWHRTTQKFRPAFGAIPWRMLLQPNAVKILFIGQDGTHIAEAANRPGTAGFGGRAHSLASFFGVEYSAAFINAYAFTIKGQYGARGAPYLHNGKLKTNQTLVPNDVWLMTQDQDSPITQWRHDLIEWIINNNRQSLKMIVLFGGAAKDSIASFIESRGGKVGSRFEHEMANIQVPEFFMKSAGGNSEFAVPFDQQGNDAYSTILKQKLNYAKSDTAAIVRKLIKQQAQEVISTLVFARAGDYSNGLIHHAQIGGFDLNKIWVEARHARRHSPTRSLKGLRLKHSEPIGSHILVLSLPHPTYLSSSKNEAAIRHWRQELAQLETLDSHTKAELHKKIARTPDYKKLEVMLEVIASLPDREQADRMRARGYQLGNDLVAKLVEKEVRKIHPYLKLGWNIAPDPSAANAKYPNENRFAAGKTYRYGRADLHKAYFDFGTPNNRMVSSSTARRGKHRDDKRRSRGAQIIIFGSRDIPAYDRERMNAMLATKPNQPLDRREMFNSRLVHGEVRYQFDPGPPPKYAKLLQDLPRKKIFAAKQGMSFERDGIAAYNIKTHPSVGAFGHYRGSFDHPKVLIIADPDGVDDLVTARALTGTRGQYLQGMMDELGVGDDYLVIKTVPFGMDGAAASEWQEVYETTAEWRNKLIDNILRDYSFDLIIADGKWAKLAVEKFFIVRNWNLDGLLTIDRQGLGNSSGIASALQRLGAGTYLPRMRNIPRSHLTYYARAWAGTSGDRVLDSQDRKSKRYRGLAFQVVVPNWVVEQRHTLDAEAQKAVNKMKAKLRRGGFPLPDESIADFLRRIGKDDAA
ncbi:MAG: hypothetical protein OYH77_00030 [Pseudomonadota bacterium]|nr:hypothetical protein [Pseudomonadota bacterium]